MKNYTGFNLKRLVCQTPMPPQLGICHKRGPTQAIKDKTFGHTIYFPLHVYTCTVKTNQGNNLVKSDHK